MLPSFRHNAAPAPKPMPSSQPRSSRMHFPLSLPKCACSRWRTLSAGNRQRYFSVHCLYPYYMHSRMRSQAFLFLTQPKFPAASPFAYAEICAIIQSIIRIGGRFQWLLKPIKRQNRSRRWCAWWRLLPAVRCCSLPFCPTLPRACFTKQSTKPAAFHLKGGGSDCRQKGYFRIPKVPFYDNKQLFKQAKKPIPVLPCRQLF